MDRRRVAGELLRIAKELVGNDREGHDFRWMVNVSPIKASAEAIHDLHDTIWRKLEAGDYNGAKSKMRELISELSSLNTYVKQAKEGSVEADKYIKGLGK
jgi:hypothetical protein